MPGYQGSQCHGRHVHQHILSSWSVTDVCEHHKTSSLPSRALKSLSERENKNHSSGSASLPFTGTKANDSHFSLSRPRSNAPPLCTPNLFSSVLLLKSKNGQS